MPSETTSQKKSWKNGLIWYGKVVIAAITGAATIASALVFISDWSSQRTRIEIVPITVI